MIPFPAEDGCGEEFGAVKDVASENLGKLGSIPTGPGQALRPYKGMKRNRRARMQGGGGEKIVRRFDGRGGGERID